MRIIGTGLVRLSRRVNQTVETALGVIGGVMVVVVAVQVFCRYVLNHSLFWSEELARFLLVWLTFLGASAGYYRKVHPSIDLLHARLPAWLRRHLNRGVYLLSLLFFAVMTVYGLQFAYFIRLQITPALHLPKWTVFSVIPFTGLILSLHAIAHLVTETAEKRRDH